MQFKNAMPDTLPILIPSSLNAYNALNFAHALRNTPFSDKIIFDGSYISHLEPFGMLIASNAIRELIETRHGTVFQKRNIHHNYATYMGFFSNAGLTANFSAAKPGNPRHVPITTINCLTLKQTAYEQHCHPCDIIEEHAIKVAKILAQDSNSQIFELFKYTVLEMFRNVIEHSESSELKYCGQYWPSKDKVEIAIVDTGIGLKNSLDKNPSLNVTDEEQAINLAITPGISSTVYGPGGPKSKWANAGYGLYITTCLCKEGGHFGIASGSKALLKTASNSNFRNTHVTGTGVQIVLKPSNIRDFEKSLASYVGNAAEIAGAKKNLAIGLSPSTILKRMK